jgi:formate hydrogenlyase subunit 3/multisubunit Na+/H+ antiporter MnhD subunit
MSILLIIISSVYVASYEAQYRVTLLGALIWSFCIMELLMSYNVRKYWKDRNNNEELENEKIPI